MTIFELRAPTSPPGLRTATGDDPTVVAGRHPLRPSPRYRGGHCDDRLSFQLGRFAETSRQLSNVGLVNRSASLQAAQLRFFSDSILQTPTRQEVRNRALNPCALVLHVRGSRRLPSRPL